MKTLYSFLAVIFLVLTINTLGYSQYRYITVEQKVSTLGLDNRIALNIPKNTNYSVKRNWIFLGLEAALLVSGLSIKKLGRNTYTDYQNYQNQIVYSSNTFSNAQLQEFESNRIELFNKANRYKKLSNGLLISSGAVLILNLTLNLSDPKAIFYLKRDPQ